MDSFHSWLQDFPVVGVGASAGGVKAFREFIGGIPEVSGMAYVLVPRLRPTYRSLMPEVLSGSTRLPVVRIADNCKLSRDHIYVLPENKMLEVTDHTLVLSPRKQVGINMPVDLFFCSLARVHGNLAVGVVLSGTDGDGTQGLRDIKRSGGVTFVEDPNFAEWDGMPRSAIQEGVVDFVLPSREIPAKLWEVVSGRRPLSP